MPITEMGVFFGKQEKVSVLDISGKQVMVAHSSEVNISDLDSGIYFVNVTCENGRTLVEKAVKY